MKYVDIDVDSVDNETDTLTSELSMQVTETPDAYSFQKNIKKKAYDQYGTMISKIHENPNEQSMNLWSILYSFTFKEKYNHLAGTRSKKWDDRELDTIDGAKIWCFMLTSVANTTFYILYINTNNIIS